MAERSDKGHPNPPNTAPDLVPSLSAREIEIARHYALGKTSKEVAKELFISQTTVRNHVAAIYQKLNIRNKTELVNLLGASGTMGLKSDDTAQNEVIKNDESVSVQTVELPDKPSIAVLPFNNMSGNLDQEYFSDGITEDIITGLSRFRELLVMSRASSFMLKEERLDITETANKLSVQFVVEGSVRKKGRQVRVTAQLIDAATQIHLWAENYDRTLEDVFAVQDDVVQTIVATLVGRIEEAKWERALQKRTDNLSAYDYWLRGKNYFKDWKGSRGDLHQAREMFEKAIDLDPHYSAAHTGLARVYLREYEWGWAESPEDAASRGLELARRAVELDDRDSTAHLALAWAYLKARSDFELAETQLERAIELNPNDYWNYCFKTWLLTCCGDLEGSISCGIDSIRRNPLLPDGCLWTIGFAQYLSGRYEDAIATFGKISKIESEIDACLAACHAQIGRQEHAQNIAAVFRKRYENQTTDRESWRSYWISNFHFKDPSAVEHLLDGLRKAGLSD